MPSKKTSAKKSAGGSDESAGLAAALPQPARANHPNEPIAGLLGAPTRPAAHEGKPRVFLLDAMSFIFRAYHAMARQRPMSTKTGVPTSATYVFVNMLRKLRADFNPEYLAAVFDVAAPTFRDHQAEAFTAVRKFDLKTQTFQQVEYGGYKANRAEMPPDLAQQLPYIRRALAAYRIPILEVSGFEADDVIGTLAHQAAAQDYPVYVVSSDKDMLQLVNDRICVLNPPKDNLICDAAKVEEILGVPPDRVVDVMALRGDSIDNIPGAPGIGDKGSVELIRRFGSLENTLAHAAEVAKKTYRESLLNNRENILLSRELVTIDCSAPIEFQLQAMKAEPPDAEAARELFTELEFTSLVKEFIPEAEVGQTEYREAKSAADVEAVYAAVPKGGVLAFAVERPAEAAPPAAEEAELNAEEEELAKAQPLLDAALKELRAEQKLAQQGLTKADAKRMQGVAISGLDAALQALSAERKQCEAAAQRPQRVAISAQPGTGLIIQLNNKELRDALCAPQGVPLAIHDYKTALHTLFQNVGLEDVRDDPMLYSYLLDPTYSSHTLPEMALRHFNLKLSGDLAEAADMTGRFAMALRKQVEEAGLLRVYEEIDLPLVRVLWRMEQAGVKIDCDVLEAMSQRLEGECNAKTRAIHEAAGETFNINSPKQLGHILFERLNLPKPLKYGKGKTVSTAVDVLEALAATHEVPRLVLEYRQLAKLKSTYVDALPALLNSSTRRLHTTFDQTNTATGRLSSRNPNLQNIPIRTELGREIRAAFIAEPGCVLMAADYSQIELRLLAHFSQDKLLVEAFRRGDDIHSLTAAEVFGVPPLMVTPEHRRRAKAVNFGIVYGLSAFGLSQQLGIEQREARHFIDAYFERYQGVRAWLDRTLDEARRQGRVETLFGRVRPIPDINSKNGNLRGFAERTAVNTPLQGTAADLIKLAMIRLHEEMWQRHLTSRMTLQVHDELLFEVPEDEVETMRTLVRDRMEQVCKLRVPLLVEIGVGPNWRDMD